MKQNWKIAMLYVTVQKPCIYIYIWWMARQWHYKIEQWFFHRPHENIGNENLTWKLTLSTWWSANGGTGKWSKVDAASGRSWLWFRFGHWVPRAQSESTKNQNTERTGKPNENVFIFLLKQEITHQLPVQKIRLFWQSMFLSCWNQYMVGWYLINPNQCQAPPWRSSKNTEPDSGNQNRHPIWSDRNHLSCVGPLCVNFDTLANKTNCLQCATFVLGSDVGVGCQTKGHVVLQITDHFVFECIFHC